MNSRRSLQVFINTLKGCDESASVSSDSSYQSNPELRKYFFEKGDCLGRTASPLQEVKVCKSFFKKKLSIEDEGSPSHAAKFIFPSSPISQCERTLGYFRKSLQYEVDALDEIVSDVSELPLKTNSIEAVKLSTS